MNNNRENMTGLDKFILSVVVVFCMCAWILIMRCFIKQKENTLRKIHEIECSKDSLKNEIRIDSLKNKAYKKTM